MAETDRREFIRIVSFGGAAALVRPVRLFAGDRLREQGGSRPAAFKVDASQNVLQAPRDARQWPGFRKALAEWWRGARERLDYDDVLYRRADFAWASSC